MVEVMALCHYSRFRLHFTCCLYVKFSTFTTAGRVTLHLFRVSLDASLLRLLMSFCAGRSDASEHCCGMHADAQLCRTTVL